MPLTRSRFRNSEMGKASSVPSSRFHHEDLLFPTWTLAKKSKIKLLKI